MRQEAYRRACKVSLDFVSDAKKAKCDRPAARYRGAVNFYIRSLWVAPGRLDGETPRPASQRVYPAAIQYSVSL
jgi:hypothetical protein